MLIEFIKTFLLIFVAELGDKSQFLVMTCAAKYSPKQVFAGMFIGIILNHSVAIIVGNCVSNIIETYLLQIFTGAIFILFGFLSFVNEKDESCSNKYYKCGPVLTVAITFLLAELGDKTQLTAMTISMESQYPFIVLLGSTLGMMTIGLIGIIIGTTLTKHIPSYIMKTISGIIFIIFGIVKIFASCNIFINNITYQAIFITTICLISFFQISKLVMNK